MKNILHNNTIQCKLLAEEHSNADHSYRKSILLQPNLKQESSFVLETYFVECETDELRTLKRASFYTVLANFL